jgi:transposase
VFIDESGISTAESRHYGWASKSETPEIERPAGGRRLNMIGAIAADGRTALRRHLGPVSGATFVKFLQEDLAPSLRKGDILIMDRASIHRVAPVATLMEQIGVTVMLLPAYSPEYNPIEMTWAWIKKQVRDQPKRVVEALDTLVADLWGRLTPSLCTGWARHAGYRQST